MFTHSNLVALILVLTLYDQVHTGEIVGGHEVTPHSKPYMVYLKREKSDGKKAYCGGVLVNEHFVMTAAHCQASSYEVFLGLHDYKNHTGVQNVTVPEAFPHEGYNKNNCHENDIMLLKLHPKAKFSKNVGSIALAGRDDIGSAPKSCVVLGWGSTENNKRSGVLLEVSVNLTDTELCAEEKFYCSEGTTGPSFGDSGGPLVCEGGKVYGLVSASRPKSNSLTVNSVNHVYKYTMIPEYIDWIENILKQK